MTDVQIWQPQAAEITTYEPPSGPLDDWIRVADQVVRLANVISDTAFVPRGLRGNPAACAAAMLTGRELNIPPMTALANIHVIGDKPGLSALVMRALVMRQGHEWQDVEVTNTRVVLKGRRKGSAEWTTASFSTADAQTARLQLGGYPQDKLYARASARLARRAFADVIAGMPYSIEELEDGVSDEDSPAAVAAAAIPADSAPAAKPRTARRRVPSTLEQGPAPDASPAHAAPPAAPASSPAQQGAGEALPPLPGEEETPSGAAVDAAPDVPDETDYDTPGTATRGKGGQLTALWTILSTEFSFSNDEKAQARAVCEHIIGRDLAGGTTGNLSYNDAKKVLDTLAHWKAQAENKGEHPRDYLIATMAAQDGARGE